MLDHSLADICRSIDCVIEATESMQCPRAADRDDVVSIDQSGIALLPAKYQTRIVIARENIAAVYRWFGRFCKPNQTFVFAD
jgi:hypothetical protein